MHDDGDILASVSAKAIVCEGFDRCPHCCQVPPPGTTAETYRAHIEQCGSSRSDEDLISPAAYLEGGAMTIEIDGTEQYGPTLGIGVFDPMVEHTCRVCGCSDYDACMDIDRGPCGWAAPNLCDSHRARDLVWALWQMLVGRLSRRR